MKRIILLLTCLSLLFLVGCSEDEMYIQQLKNEIQDLEEQKSVVEEEVKIVEDELTYIETNISELKNENELKQHIIKIQIKQSHFSLSITTHIKDDMNAIEIEIPTSKYFYDNIKVGDVLSDDFRAGSFIMSGSIGSWDVTVIEKYVLE